MNGVAHGLGRTPQAARDLARAVSGRAGQEDLGATECEGVRRPQARLELSPFRVAQLTNKDGWMHPGQMSSSPPSHKGSLEPALARCQSCPAFLWPPASNYLELIHQKV